MQAYCFISVQCCIDILGRDLRQVISEICVTTVCVAPDFFYFRRYCFPYSPNSALMLLYMVGPVSHEIYI